MTPRSLVQRLRPRLLALSALYAPKLWPLFERQLRETFDARAAEWDSLVGKNHSAALEDALASVSIVATSSSRSRSAILDVGCGTGLGTASLARSFPDHQIVGMDISLAMLRVAASKSDTSVGQVQWIVGDASKPPWKKEAFSMIVVMNAPPFVGALSRLLEPGGSLLFVWSESKKTPIWLPPRLVELACRWQGATEFQRGRAGGGEWLLASGFGRFSPPALGTP